MGAIRRASLKHVSRRWKTLLLLVLSLSMIYVLSMCTQGNSCDPRWQQEHSEQKLIGKPLLNQSFLLQQKSWVNLYFSRKRLGKLRIINKFQHRRLVQDYIYDYHDEPFSSFRQQQKSEAENAKWKRRLPQALIIGVKKGGTRALLEFLRLHPDVRASGPEPHFFDRHYHLGLGWYRRQMPLSMENQITIEKTPGYYVTPGVAARVYNMSRHVKLILAVRDPVTRAISDYTQGISKQNGGKTFEDLAFINVTTGLVDTSWSAIRIGLYVKYLQRWRRFFPASQFHIVSGEKLIFDPVGEMAKVQDFLGLSRLVDESCFYFNETKGFPCVRKSLTKTHCLDKTKGRAHPKINVTTIHRLRDFYRPFNLEFYLFVGQNFGWT